MKAEPFDFRQPPPGGLEGRVTRWLTEACDATPRTWAALLTQSARLRFEKVEPVTTSAALRRATDDAVGLRLSVAGFPDDAPLLVLPRPLLAAVVAGALGEAMAALPADRPPSPVEDALWDLAVQQFFLEAFQEAWPSAQKLGLTIAARGALHKVATLPANDLILLATLAVEGPFGSQPVLLALPRAGAMQLLVRKDMAGSEPHPADRSQMAALVCEMPAEMSITLGTAEVPLTQLTRLEKGDLVILGQRVGEPLTARVAGVDKYRVWPGAVGRRRGVQVESIVRS